MARLIIVKYHVVWLWFKVKKVRGQWVKGQVRKTKKVMSAV